MDTQDKIVPQAPQPETKAAKPNPAESRAWSSGDTSTLVRNTAVDGDDFGADADVAADEPAEDVGGELAKTGVHLSRWQIAGIFAGGAVVAAAVGGYAYWRAQQDKPKTRFERFKHRLGLDKIDIDAVKSRVSNFDFDKFDRERKDIQKRAEKQIRQAAHDGAKRVLAYTR